MKNYNIGIITNNKNLDFCKDLPNNIYLIYHLKKNRYKKNNIENIIKYFIINNCNTIIVYNFDLNEIKEKYKNITFYNDTNYITQNNYSSKKIITYNLNSNFINFNKEMKYRKDCTPDKTIHNIKNILNKNNYKVKEVGIRRSLKGSYSIRLELDNGKGSNGKGISLKLAKASAYAELMERLQSNMINKKRIETSKIDKNNKLYETLLSKTTSQYKKEFFTLDDIYFNITKAKNIKSNKTEEIPINAICSFCHTNGLASGNSSNEAISQAIFEILERYCYQEYLKNNKEVRNINIETLILTKNNKKTLQKLEKMGFKYFIKDCSLNKYPVIGFLLFNKDMTKYTFTMGADYSFNIALSRCITEMMQGVTFKQLKNKMVDYIPLEKQIRKYGESFISYNWLRCFNNNNGYLSSNFFSNKFITYKDIQFKDYLTTNEEVLNQLKNDIENDMYIIDYNTLGFDTYRVYIPYMTSVDCYDYEDLLINKNYNNLKTTYINITKANKKEINVFIDTFLKVNKHIKYDELIKPTDLFHVSEISDYYRLDFTSLLFVLCILHNKQEELLNLLIYKINNFELSNIKKHTYKIMVNCLTKKNYYDIKDEYITKEIENIINNPKEYLLNLNPIHNTNDLKIYNKKA